MSLPEEESLVERDPFPRERKAHLTGDPSPFSAASLPVEQTQPQPVKPGPKRQQRAADVNSLEQDDHQDSRRKPVIAAPVVNSPASPNLRDEQPSRSITPAIAKTEESIVRPQRLIETIVEKRIEREIISEHLRDSTASKQANGFTPQITRPREHARDEGERVQAPLKARAQPASPPKAEATSKPLTQKNPAPRRETAPVIRATTRFGSTPALPPPAPPTIHVTIGRVEVRATPQATVRPPGPRPAGPRMSLDDYLRSRGEGK